MFTGPLHIQVSGGREGDPRLPFLINRGRVLLGPLVEHAEARGSTGVQSRTYRLEDGSSVIAVATPYVKSLHVQLQVTTSTKGVEGARREEYVPVVGLAVQGSAAGFLDVGLSTEGIGAQSDIDPFDIIEEGNYILRVDGVKYPYHEKLLTEVGKSATYFQVGKAPVGIALNYDEQPIRRGERRDWGFDWFAFDVLRIAASITHVVRHPTTRQVVAVNGGLQIHETLVERVFGEQGKPYAPPESNREVRGATWQSYSDREGDEEEKDKVFIHCDIRDCDVVGTPESDLFRPDACQWARRKGVTDEAPDTLRFWVHTSPFYARAKQEGVLLEFSTSQLKNVTVVDSISDSEKYLMAVQLLDVSSTGRSILVRGVRYLDNTDVYAEFSGSNMPFYYWDVYELVFDVTTKVSLATGQLEISDASVTAHRKVAPGQNPPEVSTDNDLVAFSVTQHVLELTDETISTYILDNGNSVDYVSSRTFEFKQYTSAEFSALREDPEYTYMTNVGIPVRSGTDSYENWWQNVASAYYDDDDNVQFHEVHNYIQRLESHSDTDSVSSGGTLTISYSKSGGIDSVSNGLTMSGVFKSDVYEKDELVSKIHTTQGAVDRYEYTQTQIITDTEEWTYSDPTFDEDARDLDINVTVTRLGTSEYSTSTPGVDISKDLIGGQSVSTTNRGQRIGAIIQWQSKPDKQPCTGLELSTRDLAPNHPFGYFENRVVEIVANKCVQLAMYAGSEDEYNQASDHKKTVSRGPVITPYKAVYAPELNGAFYKQQEETRATVETNRRYLHMNRSCAAFHPVHKCVVANMVAPVSWVGRTISVLPSNAEPGSEEPKVVDSLQGKRQETQTDPIVEEGAVYSGNLWFTPNTPQQ